MGYYERHGLEAFPAVLNASISLSECHGCEPPTHGCPRSGSILRLSMMMNGGRRRGAAGAESDCLRPRSSPSRDGAGINGSMCPPGGASRAWRGGGVASSTEKTGWGGPRRNPLDLGGFGPFGLVTAEWVMG
jgi:hypothetical protein